MLHPQETLSSEEYKGAPASSPKGKTGVEKSDRRGYKVWIDLENSPHVPFFLPIIREMEARGCTVVLTARDCFQVCELADLAGLKYSKVGRHYGKNPFAKLFGLGVRILRLAPLVLGERPKISVSHNSRSSIILSALLGIPSLNIIDYEFADQRITGLFGSRQKKWVLTPALIPTENFEKCGSLARSYFALSRNQGRRLCSFLSAGPIVAEEPGHQTGGCGCDHSSAGHRSSLPQS